MPCISRFYGITVYMYADDHNPPHFHAKYGGQDVAIEIESLRVMMGRLPLRGMRLVLEWASQHQAELMSAWNLAQTGQLPTEIAPLP